MDTVYSLDEAKDWFLSHSSGSVRCVDEKAAQIIATTYLEAKSFFEET